jgi:PAS domain S-box-containing protein
MELILYLSKKNDIDIEKYLPDSLLEIKVVTIDELTDSDFQISSVIIVNDEFDGNSLIKQIPEEFINSPEKPFIIITSKSGYENLFHYRKKALFDFVLNDNLFLLTGKIQRAISLNKILINSKISNNEVIEFETQFKDYLSRTKDMIIFFDVKTSKIFECSNILLQNLGYQKNELTGKSIYDFFSEDKTGFIIDSIFPEFIKNGKLLNQEINIKLKNKTFKLFEIDIYADKIINGKIKTAQIVINNVDNTKELDLINSKFSKFLTSSLNEVLIINALSYKLEIVSNEALRNLKYSEKEIRNLTFDKIDPYFYIENHESFFENLKTGKIKTEKIETDFVRADGTRYPVILTIEFIENNENSFFIVNSKVLEENKIGINSFRELSLIVEQSSISIIVTSLSGQIQYVNPKFCELSQYSFDELIGQNPRIFKTDYHDLDFYKVMWQTIQAGNLWEGIYKNKKKNGEIYWEKSKIIPIKDSECKVQKYLGLKEDISENFILKEKNEKAEMHYRNIFENSIFGIYQITKEGILINANKTFLNITGYNSIEEINKNGFIKTIYKNSQKREHLLQMINTDNVIQGINLKWIKKDKSIIRVRVSAGLITNSNNNQIIEGIVEDVTSYNKLKEKYKTGVKDFISILETLHTPVIGINIKGEIVEWNNFAEEEFGCTKSKILGKNFAKTIVDRKNQNQTKKSIELALSGKQFQTFECYVNSTGKIRKKILLNPTPLYDLNDNIEVLMLIGNDITDIDRYNKELEEKVKERTQELKNSLEKEKELGKLKARFIAMASHEFRTPLSTISFAAGFIKKHYEKIEKTSLIARLERIEEQVDNMIKLIEDVLVEGEIHSEKKLNLENLDFVEFAVKIINQISSSTGYEKIDLKTVCEEINIETDIQYLSKIIQNLLSNAIKFNAEDKNIIFNILDCNEFCFTFEIQDFGLGIPETDLGKIFTPFYRSENAKSIAGTGLGMSILKESVEHLKGEVSVKSKINKGTTFTIKLPVNYIK